MKRKFYQKILPIFLLLTLMFPSPVMAMPPKVKAFIMVCSYGTIGGALLGFASMAFGSSPRAIAQGASLGLYSGILFGSYVLFSYKKPKPGGEGAEEFGPDGQAVDEYGNPIGAEPGGDGLGAPTPMDGGGQEGGMPTESSDDGSGGSGFGFPNRASEMDFSDQHQFESRFNQSKAPIYLEVFHLEF